MAWEVGYGQSRLVWRDTDVASAVHAFKSISRYCRCSVKSNLKWYLYGANPYTFSAPHVMQYYNVMIMPYYNEIIQYYNTI